ncbi:S-adenosyl-L-methionine-dependent methyltransferase [Jaminaea rosea]|uniref:S-adenosyl-L-methionine-dependent methyltransferase n=1 Tax=Jaminaea rosea TaxID=1569628 RepID=A0A316URQ0_9BASI|nr:S-adenosyl-L-methionine-dependent methyltransferase [Jaminaea rosea]PWN27989.1 S-adenosyl-L-methionine-dependent methyltransferase [Jaminaea rosea]
MAGPSASSSAALRLISRRARTPRRSATASASLLPPRRHATSSSSSSPLADDDATTSKRTNPAPGAPKPGSPFTIFDRNAKLLQKSRAALRESFEVGGGQASASAEDRGQRGSASRTVDYVRMAAAESLAERILDIRRQFDTIVELGSGPGYLRHFLDKEGTGCKKIVMCDTSRELLYRDEHLDGHFPFEIERHVIDEEELPFEPDSVDCLVGNTTLHWTNDLPGSLIQIQRSLRPDGVFVGSLLGGDTLFELRTSLQLAEQEREGGISPRVSPMTDSRDCASLLSRAGFSIPTVDVDEVAVSYPSIFELIHDLRDMGESNAVINRRPILSRDTLLAADAIYRALHGNVDGDGTVPATFGIIYLIGWKPDPSQPKPLKRGSAEQNLKDVLGGDADNPAPPMGGSGAPPLPPGGGKTRSFSTSARQASDKKTIPRGPTGEPDYFALLDIGDVASTPDGGWSVDLAALKASWRKQQALFHPDRLHSRPESEQAAAAAQSSLINKAYETLRDPLLRAHYLLEHAGEAVPDEAESLEDPSLLMQVMEMREQLEEAEAEDEVEPVRVANQELYDEACEGLKSAFAQGDTKGARVLATQLRYWANIAKVCREWAPGKRVELEH